jgi:CO dehydrogenase/acetyl-CoA synthase alpha subunit
MNTAKTNPNALATVLTPRQSAYMRAYNDPASPSFSNSYQSARAAGYSDQFARNLLHLNPDWLSTSMEQMAITAIKPEELMAKLAEIIQSSTEPTIIRLKAIELNMRAYSMLVPTKEPERNTVTLSLALTGEINKGKPVANR